MKKFLLLFLGLSVVISLYGQDRSNIDSLKAEFINADDNIRKAEIFKLTLTEHLWISKDTAISYINEILEILKDDPRGMAETYRIIGNVYGNFDMIPERISAYEQWLRVSKELKDAKSISRALNSLGSSYGNIGYYHEAIVYYLEAEDLYTEAQDTIGSVLLYMNMSFLYGSIEEFDKALDYRLKVLEIARNADSLIIMSFGPEAFGQLYFELGNLYLSLEEFDKTFEYYEMAEAKFLEQNDSWDLSSLYNNYGEIYYLQYNYHQALKYYEHALEMIEGGYNPNGTALLNGNIGACYNRLGQFSKALAYNNKSYKIALEVNSHFHIHFAAENLTETYEGLGNFKKAYEIYKIYNSYSDSLNISDTREKTLQAMQKAEFDSNFKDLQLARELKENEMNTEIKQQKLIRNFAFGGLILLVLGLYFAIRSFIVKQKSNLLLSRQKDEIEDKNLILKQQKKEIETIHHEVTQSIEYAEKIQHAILPDEELLMNNLADHFVLLIPRDRVSGDFYWWAEIEEQIVIAAADCTGHGVPGAFMSMLGVSFLREIVAKEYITQPNVILRKLRKEIVKTLKQEGKEGEQKDGMDIALVSFNPKTKLLQYAGANNPLYLLRQNEIEEIRPDKMPISIYDRMDKFTNHEVELKDGDSVFLFSDGYADQFGGEQGKKFKYKPFKSLLLEISDKAMSEQKDILQSTFEDWKQEIEQTDDVIVLGFKV